jgi:hypothetical protein
MIYNLYPLVTSLVTSKQEPLSPTLPVSFNKSSRWQNYLGSVSCSTLNGIEVAVLGTKNSKRTKDSQGGNIMDWTTLWMIKTVVPFLGIFALHRIWREQH